MPVLDEGAAIATAGYPMGTRTLTAPGYLNRISPMLQTGIISAVHRFPCAIPHGFTINVMTRGGASGSPVFRPDDGAVIGALYAGLHESEDGRISASRSHPTMLSLCPRLTLLVVLSRSLRRRSSRRKDVPTLAETLEKTPLTKVCTGRPFERKPSQPQQ